MKYAETLLGTAVARYIMPHGAQQQTRRAPPLLSNDGTDRT